jgi:hypothetical protein
VHVQPVDLQQSGHSAEAGGVRVTMPGEDNHLQFDLTDATSGEPIADLEPYLGAWAHVLAVDQNNTALVHIHPMDSTSSGAVHVHTSVDGQSSPNAVHVMTSFPHVGLYKLWFQFQRNGEVITVPFVIKVKAG